MKLLALITAAELLETARAFDLSRPDILRRADTDMPSNVSLVITNQCSDTIWPGVGTQAGDLPGIVGFELASGNTKNISVATNWNGRVWGRTNCTFDSTGAGSCVTGDCGGNLTCTGTVRYPRSCSRLTLYLV